MKIVFSFLCAIFICVPTFAAGNSVGNGGDLVAADFVLTAGDALVSLGKLSIAQTQAPIYQALKTAVRETEVHSANAVYENGELVPASYQDGMIKVSRAWWLKEANQKGAEKQTLMIVWHTYFQCTQIDDHDYSVSKMLVDADEK